MQKNNLRVPYGLSVHGNEEIKAVTKVLKSSTQMGKNVITFEKKISKLFSKKYGLMVNSGSSALLLAMETLDFPEGSEIITPALTFSTTVGYIVRNKLVPVFVDVEEGTYCINESKIKNLITKKTKAIVAPHLMGNIVNWAKLVPMLKKKGILIIEDSADTLGATYKNKSAGFYADISITSFYGSHIINCAGNGGMVCFNNKKQYIKAKLLRSWGRSSSLFDEKSEKIENRFNIKLDGILYDKKFVFEKIGHNLEPSELGAAFGLVQLKKLKKNLRLREINFNLHTDYLKKYSKYFILPKQLPQSKTGWLAYPITITEKAPFSRTEMQIFLEKKNIQTRVVFTGNILRQPGFKNIKAKKDKNGYPEADKVMKNGILIACHHGLTKRMISHIHNSIDEFMVKYT
ncbi:DegT/DnrJ/EryC1/StrS family aminotransferase [Candidatus Pelagibacter bacterium]|nr:aminotransferase class I/II-fold pyridoxal phosphate-dependent enzyme [Candidatus Pelagibacter bacterium]MDA8836301.1 DegT/DnrJ/EryC1/StrS family aminotransferase [Candidatus Pelagibacter bacterium]